MIRFFLPLTAVLFLLPAATGMASDLYLTHDHLYSLAAFTEAERVGLLEEIRRYNPDLPLADLTRDGPSVRLHLGSGDHMEILSNELYSLAVYVPDGIESEISRRSGPALRIGKIVRDENAVRFRFGDGRESKTADLGSILSSGSSGEDPADGVPEPSPGEDAPGGGSEPEQPHEPAGQLQKERSVKVSVAAAGRQADRAGPSEGRLSGTAASTLPEGKQAKRGRDAGQQAIDVSPAGKAAEKISSDHALAVIELKGPAPVLDGQDSDEAWTRAQRLRFPVAAAGISMEAAAVADGNRIYMLFTWRDEDPQTRHQPWIWDQGEDMYSRLSILDDGIAVQWAMDGKEKASEVPGRKTFDLWMWRAGREGVGSYASDARLITFHRPLHLASGIYRGGVEMWARLEFDKGRLPFEIVLPSTFAGPEVASYAASSPAGSASDVSGVGGWSGGKWVVEMSRAIKTEHADDITFHKGNEYAFIVNLLQGEDLYESPASGLLTLHW